MELLDAMTILKVRKKAYILFHAGYKRGQKTYDVMAPDGSTIATSILYEDAVEVSQLHYVNSTPPYGRRSKRLIKKADLKDVRRLNYGNDAMSDKSCLADYADWTFDDTELFDINKYSKRFL